MSNDPKALSARLREMRNGPIECGLGGPPCCPCDNGRCALKDAAAALDATPASADATPVAVGVSEARRKVEDVALHIERALSEAEDGPWRDFLRKDAYGSLSAALDDLIAAVRAERAPEDVVQAAKRVAPFGTDGPMFPRFADIGALARFVLGTTTTEAQ